MTNYILGVHTGHDAACCLYADNQLVAFCKEERMTRVKNAGKYFDLESKREVLRIAGITSADLHAVCFSRHRLPADCFRRSPYEIPEPKIGLDGEPLHPTRNLASQMLLFREFDEQRLLDYDRLRNYLGVGPSTEIIFTNHHRAHALATFMYSDWPGSSLYVTCDGGGDEAEYSVHHFDNGKFETLFGGDETMTDSAQNEAASIGVAYAIATRLLSFRPLRDEGKITGLAAFGRPLAADAIAGNFTITQAGMITSSLQGSDQLEAFIKNQLDQLSREDAAASIQTATETVVVAWLRRLLKLNPSRYLGLSGGVFANVRLNQKVAEIDGVEEMFIFPAMGDEGLPVGNCVDYLIRSNGLTHLKRTHLDSLCYGRPYTGYDLLSLADATEFTIEKTERPEEAAARLLQQDYIGAIFIGGMEMGPRALGARSILANPGKRDMNERINRRLQRTEFMPLAPCVLAEDAGEVFDIDDINRYACRFMTIAVEVKEDYRPLMPAVVHVDGTARPQIIERTTNRLYYDILSRFKAMTGIPCLVNTSFNAHDEPIINTPEEALAALADDRVDFLVTDCGLVLRRSVPRTLCE